LIFSLHLVQILILEFNSTKKQKTSQKSKRHNLFNRRLFTFLSTKRASLPRLDLNVELNCRTERIVIEVIEKHDLDNLSKKLEPFINKLDRFIIICFIKQAYSVKKYNLNDKFYNCKLRNVLLIWLIQSKNYGWGSQQSRPIDIEIEIVRSGATNFWKLLRLSIMLRKHFFSQSRFLKLRLFKICIKTMWINWDNQDFSRQWGTSGSKISTNWEISIKKNDKINSLSIKIETNCQDWPKNSCLNGFLDLTWDSWDWKVMSRQNQNFSIVKIKFLKVSRFSRSLRQPSWKCWDRDSWSRHDQDKIETPQPFKKHNLNYNLGRFKTLCKQMFH
jgi:hypothetical protein